jgi:hypothetical protein
MLRLCRTPPAALAVHYSAATQLALAGAAPRRRGMGAAAGSVALELRGGVRAAGAGNGAAAAAGGSAVPQGCRPDFSCDVAGGGGATAVWPVSVMGDVSCAWADLRRGAPFGSVPHAARLRLADCMPRHACNAHAPEARPRDRHATGQTPRANQPTPNATAAPGAGSDAPVRRGAGPAAGGHVGQGGRAAAWGASGAGRRPGRLQARPRWVGQTRKSTASRSNM